MPVSRQSRALVPMPEQGADGLPVPLRRRDLWRALMWLLVETLRRVVFAPAGLALLLLTAIALSLAASRA